MTAHAPSDLPHRTARRPLRRSRVALALTALVALALTACGTAAPPASSGAAKDADAPTARAQPAADRDGVPEEESEEAGDFVLVQGGLMAACDGPAPEPVAEEEAGVEPPTSPPPLVLADEGEPLPTRTPDQPEEPEEPRLDAFDRCLAERNAEHLTRALDELDDPAPDRVRAVLNRLDYPNDRIHGLRRTGATTRFLVDLRMFEGVLALKGSVTRTDGSTESTFEPVAVTPVEPIDPRLATG
ncbi:hypothetical protein [Streptomyces sp. NPDC002490]|uniref:hypothetical protein n=1 Tax=Streptomyces sp. NPDC002490 TaxID=3154416 RepID=UPI00332EA31E